jgi:hypothetical protein
MGVSFLQDYEMFHHMMGGTRPPRTALEIMGPAVLVALLVLGIVLEWLDWTWPALVVNAGFWGFFGLGALGSVLWMALTKSPDPYQSEAGLTIAVVGIPCTVVAVSDCVLYWITRPRASRELRD